MGTRIWTRLRRWFGAGQSVAPLDLAFAHYGEPEERRARSRSRPQPEMLHPLQGWREEANDGLSTDEPLFRMGVRPSLSRTMKNRTDGRRFPS